MQQPYSSDVGLFRVPLSLTLRGHAWAASMHSVGVFEKSGELPSSWEITDGTLHLRYGRRRRWIAV